MPDAPKSGEPETGSYEAIFRKQFDDSSEGASLSGVLDSKRAVEGYGIAGSQRNFLEEGSQDF